MFEKRCVFVLFSTKFLILCLCEEFRVVWNQNYTHILLLGLKNILNGFSGSLSLIQSLHSSLLPLIPSLIAEKVLYAIKHFVSREFCYYSSPTLSPNSFVFDAPLNKSLNKLRISKRNCFLQFGAKGITFVSLSLSLSSISYIDFYINGCIGLECMAKAYCLLE